MDCLDEEDMQISNSVFSARHGNLFQKTPINEEMENKMFTAWLILNFYKDNAPLIDWFVNKHSSKLTHDEKEVLLAGKDKHFEIFRVEGQTDENLNLVDVRGKKYVVETIDLSKINPGVAAYAQITSKGDKRYFIPGIIAPWDDDLIFQHLKKINDFRDSWNSFLEGFFKYLVSEYNLSEKTADRHTENVNLLLMFLENETDIESFEKISKPMLKTGLKKFIQQHIINKADIDKVYYSLYRFFEYLSEERTIKNEKVINWLGKRTS
ncbi:MAG: hypothetical protein ABID38_00725 [Candidatus Diapherotrites archaeon]